MVLRLSLRNTSDHSCMAVRGHINVCIRAERDSIGNGRGSIKKTAASAGAGQNRARAAVAKQSFTKSMASASLMGVALRKESSQAPSAQCFWEVRVCGAGSARAGKGCRLTGQGQKDACGSALRSGERKLAGAVQQQPGAMRASGARERAAKACSGRRAAAPGLRRQDQRRDGLQLVV